MNKRTLSTIVTILALILLIGCSLAAPAPTPTPAAPIPDATLTIRSGDQSVTLTWEDIQEMPTYEGLGGLISSVGNVTPPSKYKGIALEDLCGLVGGITEANSVRVVASDGYAMTFSYDQVTTGALDTYDPATGENAPFDGKLWAVIAYEREGEPLLEEKEGRFRHHRGQAGARSVDAPVGRRAYRGHGSRDLRNRSRAELSRHVLDRRRRPHLDRHPTVAAGWPHGRRK
jgi:hypothetical protein